jgi:hypothetical protein
MLDERIIALFPSIERLAAEKASNVVWIDLIWVVEETCFRKLADVSGSSVLREAQYTSSGESHLCGHFIDLGALVLALDALLFDSCCVFWKEASRLSYVKYSSAISGIVMMTSSESPSSFLCVQSWISWVVVKIVLLF